MILVYASRTFKNKMATFKIDKDERDQLICCICLEVYNDGTRAPKFLKCFHTCCLACLKVHAKDKKIECPYCRKVTFLKSGRLEHHLKTNFYLLPKVEKIAARREQLDIFRSKTKDNWVQTIALRGNVEKKLGTVHDACRLLESVIAQKCEENNEKMVILQSLVEKPADAEDILFKTDDELKEELEASQKDFMDAEQINNSLLEVEKLCSNITLVNQSGESFEAEPLRDQQLSFNNTSAKYGPQVGAVLCMLTFIIYQMMECKLMKAVTLEETAAPSVLPTKQSLYASLQQSDHSSSSDDNSFSYAYMQFRVNDYVTPYVVIKLAIREAPLMCKTFLDYCRGVNNIRYRGAKISKIGHALTAGKFDEMKQINSAMIPVEEPRYPADRSRLRETKGAVRMRIRGRCEQGHLVGPEFSIICRDGFQTDQPMTTVFGYVVSGMNVCKEISELDLENANKVDIADCGAIGNTVQVM